jgi:RND family efflux transporter MFP subunit
MTPIFRSESGSAFRRTGSSLAGRVAMLFAAVAIGTLVHAEPPPALTVTAATPQTATWPVAFEAFGSISPWHEAIIGAQVGGYRLVDVRVDVGDRVTKGQLLARLDAALLRAEEAQLVAAWEQAEANRRRGVAVRERGGMSEQDVQQLATAAKGAAAALDAKRVQLRYTDVVAPDAGTISARVATLGAVVNVGDELFRVIRADRLEWRGELPAHEFVDVEIGQRVALRLPDGSKVDASVRQRAPALDAQTRLGIVYADLEPGSRAHAGMYVQGRIVLRDSAALVIPATSLVIRDGTTLVARLVAAGATSTVALQPVTVGRRDDTRVEILGGLAEADRVVARGAGLVNDGDVVKIVGAPP